MTSSIARPRWPLHLVLALSSLSMASIGVAEEWRLVFDPAATEITFELGATLHTVHGTAQLSEGHIEFDPERGTAAGRIVVGAESLSTDNESRDAKMHDKVLESARYVDIVFEPHSMNGQLLEGGESRLTVEGTFTVHGEAHPLSLDVVVRRDGDSLSTEVEFDVPYVAWGMKDPSRLVMRAAKEVRVRIEGAGRLIRPPASTGSSG